MFFEHLVRFDAENAAEKALLTRQRIWRGLWRRVEAPELFLPGVTGCTLFLDGEAGIRRRVEFGQARIHDRVRYQDGEWLRFEVEAEDEHAGGALTIALEEAEPGVFALRFSYRTTLKLEGDEARYADYVKAAYQDSDLETVRVIRQLIAEMD